MATCCERAFGEEGTGSIQTRKIFCERQRNLFLLCEKDLSESFNLFYKKKDKQNIL
jgi:hypothetical protein